MNYKEFLTFGLAVLAAMIVYGILQPTIAKLAI